MVSKVSGNILRSALLNDVPKCFGNTRNLHNNMEKKRFYDIIVAGGGMVGTAMACSLGVNSKLSNRKILLLEESPEKKWEMKPQYSNRVSALGGHSKTFLGAIGAWDHIESARFKAVKKMQIWDANSDAVITFNDENLEKDIAYIVENDVCMSAINKELKKTPVEVVYGAKIKSYDLPNEEEYRKNGLVHLHLQDGTTYSCNLLIGADGANSKIRNTMGVQYLSWSYKQMGVVATPTNNIVAWQRFLPTGPVALLPLTDDLSSLVWSTSSDEAKMLLELNPESFWKNYPRYELVENVTRRLSDVMATILGPTVAAGPRQLQPSISSIIEGSRAAFPLGFGHSTRYVGHGVALIGDAAHRIHPLAGMGVNLGFGDVNCLQRKLSEAAYGGCELGDHHYLLQYESERQRHNLPRMIVIDALQKLYGTSAMPVVLLRTLGLQLTDALRPLKKMIMKEAAL
ncbi:hypothetical protein J437_LFUL008192 [Ladona fulva]|uniref:Ubiquinone biosynthesis monooxygenase COQ6, mitochondrial n=1 Tax=Ladona fulva TaxID=123851 RepID=A0A8K0K3C7_LADFU|nr:hypothetical protein J437_LFUL008192 [Ladona fulva]